MNEWMQNRFNISQNWKENCYQLYKYVVADCYDWYIPISIKSKI